MSTDGMSIGGASPRVEHPNSTARHQTEFSEDKIMEALAGYSASPEQIAQLNKPITPPFDTTLTRTDNISLDEIARLLSEADSTPKQNEEEDPPEFKNIEDLTGQAFYYQNGEIFLGIHPTVARQLVVKAIEINEKAKNEPLWRGSTGGSLKQDKSKLLQNELELRKKVLDVVNHENATNERFFDFKKEGIITKDNIQELIKLAEDLNRQDDIGGWDYSVIR